MIKKIWILSLFFLWCVVCFWMLIFKSSEQFAYLEFYNRFFDRKEKDVNAHFLFTLDNQNQNTAISGNFEWYIASDFLTSSLNIILNQESTLMMNSFSWDIVLDVILSGDMIYWDIKNIDFFAGEGNIKNKFYKKLAKYLQEKKVSMSISNPGLNLKKSLISLISWEKTVKMFLVSLLQYWDSTLSEKNINITTNGFSVESDYLKGDFSMKLIDDTLLMQGKLNEINFFIDLDMDWGKRKIKIQAFSSLDPNLKIFWKWDFLLTDADKKSLQIPLDHYTPLEYYLQKWDISF